MVVQCFSLYFKIVVASSCKNWLNLDSFALHPCQSVFKFSTGLLFCSVFKSELAHSFPKIIPKQTNLSVVQVSLIGTFFLFLLIAEFVHFCFLLVDICCC
jgi:hypothetical protein